eukprot:TRINITY_DN6080_c0_g5_i1.p1 TRINITY_DN6080_c0_g5~~TRINITY_DN6080_c0_g5_i1.p1  ORF type:complete len:617 (+),score=76.31 TRINITY_DN6080_c0_g5_i1:73-1851(+)
MMGSDHVRFGTHVSCASTFEDLLRQLREEHLREVYNHKHVLPEETSAPMVRPASFRISQISQASADADVDSAIQTLSSLETRVGRAGRQSRFEKTETVRKVLEQSLSFRALSADIHYLCGVKKEEFSDKLDWFISAIITLNIITMGISADVDRDWSGWLVIEAIFLAIYFCETGFRVYMLGMKDMYFSGRDRWLNLFDIPVLLIAAIDLIMGAGSAIDVTFVRFMRLCRLVRLLRVLRAPFFREILMMVNGFAGSARTLFWAAVMMCFPYYMLALLLRETFGTIDPNDEQASFQAFFNTVGASWFTLFRCVMGECNDEKGRPIPVLVVQHLGIGYGYFYTFVMIISVFGIFNVIAAVFVENVINVAKNDEKLAQRRRINDERRTAAGFKRLLKVVVESLGRHYAEFSDLRERESTERLAAIEINVEEFKTIMGDREVNDILDHLDVSAEDRCGLFEILDADCSGTLCIEEVVTGLMRLRGQPRRGDVVRCSLILREVQLRLAKLLRNVEATNAEVHQNSALLQQMQATRSSRGPTSSSRMDNSCDEDIWITKPKTLSINEEGGPSGCRSTWRANMDRLASECDSLVVDSDVL